MNVKLVTFTNRPTETMMWAFMNMHMEIPDNLENFKPSDRDKKDFLKLMSENPHSSVLEFVNTVWFIDGCSRAFQQQLTRTRTAAYSIQSLRIVNAGNFTYTMPEEISKDETKSKCFQKHMRDCKQAYNNLISLGAKAEDARGVLPLNVHSPITMSINLRALQHMLEMRLCYLTQGEYRKVAEAMISEMREKLGSEYAVLFKKPCHNGTCPMPIYCGKVEVPHKPIFKKLKLERWLKG